LEPDIVIVSVKAKLIENIIFDVVRDWEPIISFPRTKDGKLRSIPFDVYLRHIQIAPGKSAVLVSGQAAQKPFGLIGNSQKAEVGKALQRYLDGLS
jgi:hypothetical protein